MWWSKFEKRLTRAFNANVERGVGWIVHSDSMKIWMFIDKIKADFLTPTKAPLELSCGIHKDDIVQPSTGPILEHGEPETSTADECYPQSLATKYKESDFCWERQRCWLCWIWTWRTRRTTWRTWNPDPHRQPHDHVDWRHANRIPRILEFPTSCLSQDETGRLGYLEARTHGLQRNEW